MCGFVAVVDPAGGLEERLLVRMRDVLEHRGPDEAGLWIGGEGRVGFGHRRLSIVDLSHGQQPMVSPDGAVVLSYNGEIYNHQALRRELERTGRRFATRCDTEALLAAYEEWGEDCLARLDGMFAFVLWDARRRRLFFARDRLGKKPLYHTATHTGYAFASEIKALLEHPQVSRAVDQAALARYLSFLVVPAPETMFAGISKLPAAHCGTWSAEGGLRIWRWWTVPNADLEGPTRAEAASSVRDLFTSAVEKRMMSDVPFGVYLSGGVDSSANVAIMSTLTEEPVRTFSVAFADEPSLDELHHAHRVSELFGTEHKEIVVDDSMVLASLPDVIHHQDEPIADPVCVPLLHLARLTKDSGVTVVQIGEGSDEIFRGYSAYAQVFAAAERLRRLLRVVPAPVVAGALRLGRPLVSPLRYEFMLEAVRHGVPPAHGVAGFAEHHKRQLLARNGFEPAHVFLRQLAGSGRTREEVAGVSLEHELRLRLSELLLMRVDKMTMAASVEGRAPFLDHALVEYAARLPLALHSEGGRGKLVLKEGLRGVLPAWVLDRPKQGFGAPVWRWVEKFRPLFTSEILRDPVLSYFDRKATEELLARPATTRTGFEAWVLLNFALWHRHWIEGCDLRESPLVAPGSVEA